MYQTPSGLFCSLPAADNLQRLPLSQPGESAAIFLRALVFLESCWYNHRSIRVNRRMYGMTILVQKRRQMMRAIGCLVAVLCVAMVGCASRTQANVGSAHAGGDIAAHKDWNLSFASDANRTEIGMGFVTIGVDWEWTECTQAVSAYHKTELTHDENAAEGDSAG